METALPPELFNSKSGQMYKSFIKDYSGSMKPSDFAACICQKMTEPENYYDPGDKDDSDQGQKMKSMSGKIFEFIIAEILKHHKITPFYMQCVMRNVPNSKFDFLCFNDQEPVIISAKTSLAERWRQSAFEGYFLKQVYRQAKSFVITNKEQDAINRNKDLKDNKISGVDHFYYIQSNDMNTLVDKLKLLKFKEAEPVYPVDEHNGIVK